jgi:hypothetical protein
LAFGSAPSPLVQVAAVRKPGAAKPSQSSARRRSTPLQVDSAPRHEAGPTEVRLARACNVCPTFAQRTPFVGRCGGWGDRRRFQALLMGLPGGGVTQRTRPTFRVRGLRAWSGAHAR